MRILACVIALAASVGLSPLVAAGAEIPLITHAGRPYVPLDRVAAALRARPDWTSASARARTNADAEAIALKPAIPSAMRITDAKSMM